MNVQSNEITAQDRLSGAGSLSKPFLETQYTAAPLNQPTRSKRSRTIITPDILSGTSWLMDIFLIIFTSSLVLISLNSNTDVTSISLGYTLILNIGFLLGKFLPDYTTSPPTSSFHLLPEIGLPLLFSAAVSYFVFNLIPSIDQNIAFWVPTSLIASIPTLIAGRYIYSYTVRHSLKQGVIRWNIALYGTTPSSLDYLMNHARDAGGWKQIKAVFTDMEKSFDPRSKGTGSSVGELANAIRAGEIDEVVVFLDDHDPVRRKEILDVLAALPVKITLHYGIENEWLQRIIPDRNSPQCLLELTNSPLHGTRCLIKRCLDIILSSVGIIVLSPLMTLTALLIRLDSHGPIFFIQERYGFNNQIINVIKFRSMYHRPPDEGTFIQAQKNDHRVTKIGRLLRKSSIDELPQLFNVFRGDMSIVGPRPHATTMDDQYRQVIKHFNARYAVMPGITGWAQVNGARGETPDIKSMERRFSLDRYYIANWSLWLDIKIIFLTAARIWKDRQAY